MKQAQEGHPSAMRMAFTYDVFLSHSSKDKDTVREIAERLQADGLRVWFDEWEIRPGGNIPVALERGLKRPGRSYCSCLPTPSTPTGRRWRARRMP